MCFTSHHFHPIKFFSKAFPALYSSIFSIILELPVGRANVQSPFIESNRDVFYIQRVSSINRQTDKKSFVSHANMFDDDKIAYKKNHHIHFCVTQIEFTKYRFITYQNSIKP